MKLLFILLVIFICFNKIHAYPSANREAAAELIESDLIKAATPKPIKECFYSNWFGWGSKKDVGPTISTTTEFPIIVSSSPPPPMLLGSIVSSNNSNSPNLNNAATLYNGGDTNSNRAESNPTFNFYPPLSSAAMNENPTFTTMHLIIIFIIFIVFILILLLLCICVICCFCCKPKGYTISKNIPRPPVDGPAYPIDDPFCFSVPCVPEFA